MAFAPKTPDHHSSASFSGAGKRVTTAVVAFAYMCSKQASRVTKKLKPSSTANTAAAKQQKSSTVPQSPRTIIQKPKQLLATISNKAITLVHRKKKPPSEDHEDEDDFSGDWGDGGVWQRSILMGDKCQPLDFSGVIYYDSAGKQLSELPIRSPRASPLPSYLQKTTPAAF